ncbi:MAG: Npt1/Npt2 family nucleotide transporter [Candidatus Krumholzibacteriia bacterium]
MFALRHVVDIRSGERRLTLLMVLCYFLLLVALYLLKPARDSLFLTRASPAQLPLVFILTAVVTAPLAALYARAGERFSVGRLVQLTFVLLVASLLALRLLVTAPALWTIYLLYAWVGVSGGLATSLFWLLANGLYDAAQGKRLFTVLALGGILGGFVGGELTNALVRWAGLATADLLWVSAGVLSLCALLARFAWRTARAGAGERRDPVSRRRRLAADQGHGLAHLVGLVRGSRHLRLTVGIIGLTVATATLVDFQFKTVVFAEYPEGGELTAFLGRFYGRVSLLSIAVQALISGRIIRGLGVGGAVLVLPSVLLAGSLLMLVGPLYAAALILRGSDLALKHSLDRTARELLFLPMPLELVKRTKLLVDTLVERWARGVAGLLLLALTAVLGFGVREIAAVAVVLLVAWLALGGLMRREYLESFRRALQRRALPAEALPLRWQDRRAMDLLLVSLDTDQAREIVYALELLHEARDPRLGAAVKPLLEHEDAAVRRQALETLAVADPAAAAAAAVRLADDPDADVRCEALRVLGTAAPGGLPEVLAEALVEGRSARRDAALLCLARHGGQSEAALLDTVPADVILDTPGAAGSAGRAALAAALGAHPARDEERILQRLVADADPAVVRVALETLGRRRLRSWVPLLVERLADRRYRPVARAALARFGADILPELAAVFEDRQRSYVVRGNIPAILAAIPEQAVVEYLLETFGRRSDVLRHEVLRALSRLRSRHPHLRFDRDRVEREVVRHAERYFRAWRIARLVRWDEESGGDREGGSGGDGGPPGAATRGDVRAGERLLERALAEAQRLHLESVFRLLGLLYPQQDIASAYQGLVSGRRVLRASAQEFLDNLLDGEIKRFVLPLVDEPEGRRTQDEAAGLFALGIRDRAGALQALLSGDETWLRCCAIAACRSSDPAPVWRAVAAAAGSGEPLVAETARWRLGRERREETGMLSVFEKVLFLQHVDLFHDVPTSQLAALAAIAEEVEHLPGDVVYRENDVPDALYLVLEGHVRLHQGGRDLAVAEPMTPFGTWALLDDQPRVVTATVLDEARLLRIDREDFADLLADQVQIAQGIMRAMAHRLRALAERVH